MSKSETTPIIYAGSRVWCETLTYEILQDFATIHYGREPQKDVKTSVRKHFGNKVFFILVGILSSNISAWYDQNFDAGKKIETIGKELRKKVKNKAREAIFKAKIIFEKTEMFGLTKKLRLINNYQDVLVDNDVIETVLNENIEVK